MSGNAKPAGIDLIDHDTRFMQELGYDRFVFDNNISFYESIAVVSKDENGVEQTKSLLQIASQNKDQYGDPFDFNLSYDEAYKNTFIIPAFLCEDPLKRHSIEITVNNSDDFEALKRTLGHTVHMSIADPGACIDNESTSAPEPPPTFEEDFEDCEDFDEWGECYIPEDDYIEAKPSLFDPFLHYAIDPVVDKIEESLSEFINPETKDYLRGVIDEAARLFMATPL